MKAKDLRNDSLEELRSALKDTRKKLMEMRFQQTSGTLKNSCELGNARRDIARLLTVIKEKQHEK